LDENPLLTAAAGTDGMAVAWVDNDNTTSSVYFSSSTDDAANWSTPRVVTNTPTINYTLYDRLSIAYTSSGVVGMTWTKLSGDFLGDGDLVQVSVSHDGGVTWALPLEPTQNSSAYAEMIPLTADSFLLSWVEYNESSADVWASSFETPELAATGPDSLGMAQAILLATAMLIVGAGFARRFRA
jgi:hypothetical protein